ncbi:MAG TPA: hypothetical protein VGN95_01115 [Pyrinomonadaceae bacterium]|jgi:hypothetical protein|nr:hypothetical protein [Pyrinomonadaceae bacterium]
MKSKPRTVCRLRSLVLVALVLAFASIPVLSQKRGRTQPKATTQNKNAERVRRAQAVTLLVETADKARLFDALFYRARIQMLAADALWPHDERQARAIFRRAWEAATASDKAEKEEAARGTDLFPATNENVTDARDEVLRKAAVRDARLAEIFLRDLLGEKDGASVDRNEATRRLAGGLLSANGARRLTLAYEMLEAGETRRAVEIIAPTINEGVGSELIAFIVRLRERSITDADMLYLRLIEHAAADPQTDANAVLLLSSPIVSPRLIVVVDEFGAVQFSVLTPASANAVTQQPVNERAQVAFYNLAASVLSRPLTQRDGALTVQELMARFYATGRLLPFYENSSAPYSAYAPALRARHSELFNEIEASRREQVSSQFGVDSLTPAGFVDPLRSEADQLSRATDSAERERIAIVMVRTAVRNKYWDRARRAAAEIEDVERRRAALAFIQVQQIKDISAAYAEEKEDDFESVVKFVREADVPPFARAWGLAQAAVIAARKRNAQTSQTVAGLINEAESYAARVAQGTPERVAAYGVVTTAAARVDTARSWSLLRELVKAANSVEDFTGEEVSFELVADDSSDTKMSARFSVEAEAFRLDGIFATMARLDFDKALAESRALDGDVPQAFATIAIARTVLEKENSGVRIQKPE